MTKNAKVGVVCSIIAFWIIVIVVLVVVSGKKQDQSNSDNKATPKDGIDREKVLKHMTTEANTVIFFSDKGEVVSSNFGPLVAMMTGEGDQTQPQAAYVQLIEVGMNFVPEVKSMKGRVMVTYSPCGNGNRFTRQRAEAILSDCIKDQ